MSARETIRNVLLVHYADSPNPALVADTLMANARTEEQDDVLVVSRFDTAIEPAPEEEPVLTIGAIADDGRPVALLLDEETRRKVAGWLASRAVPPMRDLAAVLAVGAVAVLAAAAATLLTHDTLTARIAWPLSAVTVAVAGGVWLASRKDGRP